jgi:hypothetical protein
VKNCSSFLLSDLFVIEATKKTSGKKEKKRNSINMKSKMIFVLGLCLCLVAFTSGQVFVEEFGETETISIDEPVRDVNTFDEASVNDKSFGDVLSRSKRASDYSSEAYEDEEESAPAGSGSEATYEDEEVRFKLH